MQTIPLYSHHLTYEEGRCFDEWLIKRLTNNLWDFARRHVHKGQFVLTDEAAIELQQEVVKSLNQYIAESQGELEVWGE